MKSRDAILQELREADPLYLCQALRTETRAIFRNQAENKAWKYQAIEVQLDIARVFKKDEIRRQPGLKKPRICKPCPGHIRFEYHNNWKVRKQFCNHRESTN